MYNCRGHGALLFLPHGGHRLDIIQTKVFEDYIRDHVASWFTWAQKNKHGIERTEDLVLVSGCTLVSSWAAAAFVDSTMEAKNSLAGRTLSNGAECFVWDNIRGAVEYNEAPWTVCPRERKCRAEMVEMRLTRERKRTDEDYSMPCLDE